MPGPVKGKRTYDSPRRREQARATRRAILSAAGDLFVDQGYAATTIGAIAEAARVSPETVYAAFGNKRALLSTLLDESIAGDDEPVPVLERAWVDELRATPTARARLRILVRNGRLILERRGPIEEVLRGAAAADPEIAALWETSKTQRLAGQRELLRIVVGTDGLRRGVDFDEAVDTYFAVASPETYRLLVTDRGWTADAFEAWLERTLSRLLLR